MTSYIDMMLAFEHVRAELAQRNVSWVISVFADNDPRVQGNAWGIEEGDAPIMFLSDDLYALYCASLGIENLNQRKAS